MYRIFAILFLSLMLVSCAQPPASNETGAPAEPAAMEATDAASEDVKPLDNPNVLAQNLMVLAQKMQSMERTLANVAATTARLDFYAQELAKTPELQGPYADAQKSWDTAVERLQQEAQARRDQIIQQQQGELKSLRERLEALEKEKVVAPAPAVTPEAEDASQEG